MPSGADFTPNGTGLHSVTRYGRSVRVGCGRVWIWRPTPVSRRCWTRAYPPMRQRPRLRPPGGPARARGLPCAARAPRQRRRAPRVAGHRALRLPPCDHQSADLHRADGVNQRLGVHRGADRRPGDHVPAAGGAALALFRELAQDIDARGNDVPDAYLAAYAVENNATLAQRRPWFRAVPSTSVAASTGYLSLSSAALTMPFGAAALS